MKHSLRPLEKKIRASGEQYFSSFHRPRTLSFSKPIAPRQSTWIVPSFLSTSFGVLLVALTLQATQARGAFEDAIGLTRLNHVMYPNWNASPVENGSGSFLQQAITSFTSAQLQNFASTQENKVYSPLSSYVTLAMLYEASEDITQEELSALLHIEDVSVLQADVTSVFHSTFQQRYQGTTPVVQSRLAHAMFVKDTYPIAPAYAQKLATSYFAEVFHTSFDESAKQSIANWINQKTNNFLAVEPNELSIQNSTQWLLYNTLYMRSNWVTPFEENLTKEATFTPDEGDAFSVNMMKKTLVEASVFEHDAYTIVDDEAFGGYKFQYILPSLNHTVASLLTQEGFLTELETHQEHKTTQDIVLSVPQFSLMNTVDLKPWIQEATPSLFDPLLANLSNAGEGLFVQSLTQDARVDVFEQGFEAAAVTEADVGTTSLPSVPTVEIRLDRSFIFLITNQEGLLHFIGIVHQPFEA